MRYRGYYYDVETGLYYVSSRYYDPVTQRFVNADGYVSTGTGILGFNMFAYCNNTPVNGVDVTGERFVEQAGMGGGGGAGAAANPHLLADSIIKGIKTIVSGISKLFATTEAVQAVVATTVVATTAIARQEYFELRKYQREQAKEEAIPTQLPTKDPTHHIVAKADPRAAESRQILREVGIEPLTDVRNLVVLPQTYHVSLHTTAYHNYVTERLRPVAGDKSGVEATLASLKAEILERSAIGIRWE